MVNYLDYAATTPVHPEVLEVITKEMSSFGNPKRTYYCFCSRASFCS